MILSSQTYTPCRILVLLIALTAIIKSALPRIIFLKFLTIYVIFVLRDCTLKKGIWNVVNGSAHRRLFYEWAKHNFNTNGKGGSKHSSDRIE